MRIIQLTRGKVTMVDDADYEYLSQFKWLCNNTGYAARTEYLGKIDGKYKNRTVLMHREIMGFPTGMDIDHRDHNTLDNRRSNLRVCTRSQNTYNRYAPQSKYNLPKGVTLDVNKARNNWTRYSARIQIEGKSHFLGYYKTVDEAAEAYKQAALEYQGEFACV